MSAIHVSAQNEETNILVIQKNFNHAILNALHHTTRTRYIFSDYHYQLLLLLLSSSSSLSLLFCTNVRHGVFTMKRFRDRGTCWTEAECKSAFETPAQKTWESSKWLNRSAKRELTRHLSPFSLFWKTSTVSMQLSLTKRLPSPFSL